MSDQSVSDDNPHPGEHILDELEALGMSQADLARWLGTSPQMWLNLQAIHDLRKAEDEAGDAIREQVTPPSRTG